MAANPIPDTGRGLIALRVAFLAIVGWVMCDAEKRTLYPLAYAWLRDHWLGKEDMPPEPRDWGVTDREMAALCQDMMQDAAREGYFDEWAPDMPVAPY